MGIIIINDDNSDNDDSSDDKKKDKQISSLKGLFRSVMFHVGAI